MSDLNKLQIGVVSTDPNREASAEPLSSRSQAIPSDIGGLFEASKGGTRVVGDLTRAALFNDSVPSFHPARNRRLSQQKLIYGAEIWAEGTEGSFTTGTNFNTGGVVVTGFPTTLRLVITDSITGVNRGSYSISALSGTAITVTSNAAIASGLTWQLVSLQPNQMLPMPSEDGVPGNELTYLTVLPAHWPVGQGATRISITSTSYTGVLTQLANGRLQFDGTHVVGFALYAVNDVVFIGQAGVPTRAGIRARVDNVVFTPGPNQEVLTLEPFFGEEVLDFTSATQVTKIARVSDFTLTPYTRQVDRVIYNNKDFLDGIRVYPLIAPANGPFPSIPNSAVSVLGAVNQPLVTDRQAGYNVVLYPADVSGDVDTTRPITNLSSVVINPNITDVQTVTVDYAQGAVILSHPIPESGGDLNPNGYVAPDGTRRLFAVYVAFNRSYTPESVRSLSADGPLTGASIAYERADTVYPLAEVVNRISGWVIRPDALADYHVDFSTQSLTSPAVSVTADRQGLVSSYSPQIIFQRRSQNTPIIGAGGVVYGPTRFGGGLGDTSPVQQIALFPASSPSSLNVAAGTGSGFGTNNGAHVTFSEGWKDLEMSAPGFVAVGFTGVQLFVNDLEVLITLPTGAFSAAGLQAILISSIVAAGVAANSNQQDGQDFHVVLTPNGTVMLSARDTLYTGVGTAHPDLGIPNNTRVDAVGIFQSIFTDVTLNRTGWDYNARANDSLTATWQGTDVNLEEGASLAGVGDSFESSYTNLVISASGPVTYGVDQVFTPDLVLYARVQEYGVDVVRKIVVKNASIDFTGLGAGLYHVYWDRFTRDFVTIVDGVVSDKSFETGLYQGIPIARVFWDGGQITDLQTALAFTINRKSNEPLTVGVGGMFPTVQAACYWIETHDPVTRSIHLVSDISVDALNGGDAYIPQGVTLDGQGYAMTLTNFDGSLSKPLFHLRGLIDNSASRGVTLKNLRILFDDAIDQSLTSIVLDDGVGSSPSAATLGLTLQGIYYDGGSATNIVGAIVFAQQTMDLYVSDSEFSGLDLLFSGFQGCRSYYVSDTRFNTVSGNDFGATSLFGISSQQRVYATNVTYSTSSSLTKLCAFIRPFVGESSSGCYLHIDRCRLSMNYSNAIQLDNTTVLLGGIRTDLFITNSRITTEDGTQSYIGGVTRRVNVHVQGTEFLRLTGSVTTPSAGFTIGDDTGGGLDSYWKIESSHLYNANIAATSYAGLHVILEDNTMDAFTAVLVSAGSGVGQFTLRGNTMEEGTLSFTSAQVRLIGGSYSATSGAALVAPMIQFNDCDVNISGGIRITKTTPDTNSTIRFRLTNSVDMSDISVTHGNGATNSAIGIQANADAVFTRYNVSNIVLTYLGTDTGLVSAGFNFLARGSVASASFTLVGFIFRDYPLSGSTSTAMRFGANWRVFTIGSGFTVAASPGTNFVGAGVPTDFYLETTSRFVTA